MDINLSSEDLAFRDEVRSFFEENKIKSGEDYFSWRLGWFEKAREKGGWDVPKWPEKFGAPGWTPTQHYIWEQETAKANIPFDLPFGLGMLAPILMNYGNEEQQNRFLPDIRDRKVNWCQGYSEPGAGSDLANLKTKAVLSDDGTYYTVNGSKIWTTLAHVADWIFCLTRTDDSGIKQQGITFLLFPMKQEGIEVKPIITLGGSHTVNTVHFTDQTHEDFDVIIACTGFKIKHKFFDKDLVDFESGPVPLFHKMIPANINNLYFIGLFQPLGCIWPGAELQSKLAAKHLAGLWKPSNDIQKLIDLELKNPDVEQVKSPRHTITVDDFSFRKRLKKELKSIKSVNV